MLIITLLGPVFREYTVHEKTSYYEISNCCKQTSVLFVTTNTNIWTTAVCVLGTLFGQCTKAAASLLTSYVDTWRALDAQVWNNSLRLYSNSWTMWEGRERKQLQTYLSHYSGICIEGLRKIAKNVRNGGIRAETVTRDLLSKNQKCQGQAATFGF